jgi:hypothetical protein
MYYTGASNLASPSDDGDSVKQGSIDMIKLGKVSVATKASKISPITEIVNISQRTL